MGPVFNKEKFHNEDAKILFLSFKEKYEMGVKMNSRNENKLLLSLVVKTLENSPKLVSEFNFLLSNYPLKDSAALCFSELLETNGSRILKLYLDNTSITRKGAERLATMLVKNKTLLELDISNNSKVGDAGGVAVVKALKENTTLRILHMNNIRAGTALFEAICEMLWENKSLRSLSVKENDMEEGIIQRVEAAISMNTTLTNMVFTSNAAPEAVERLLYLLERNMSIQEIIDLTLAKCAQRNFKMKMNTFKKSVRKRTAYTEKSNANAFDMLKKGKEKEGTATPANAPDDSGKARFSAGMFEMKGKRPDMQDYSFINGRYRGRKNEDLFAVFDGHGGRECAKYCGENFPRLFKQKLTTMDVHSAFRETFMELNRQVSPWAVYTGTTALVVFIQNQRIYVANAGDSRAVLSRAGGPLRLSLDHKPDLPDEMNRIKEAGGYVNDNRVNGILAVSRAIGDSFLQPFVTAQPFISRTDMTDDDQFIVLACDGVYDVLSDSAAISVVSTEKDPSVASKKLCETAYNEGSGDNISSVVVYLDR